MTNSGSPGYGRVTGLALCLAIGLSLPGSGASETSGITMPDAAGMDTLRAGGWILENVTSSEKGAAAGILILMHAPVEQVWGVIVSCRYAEAFVAGLEYCEVLEDTGDYALTHQVADKGWAAPQMDYTFETRRQPWQSMAFHLVSGNLKVLQGTWEFQPLPEGLLVRHYLELRPSVPVPRWLVRRNLNKDLPDMMQCIRGLADGSGSPERHAADLEKCPGDPP